MHSTTSERVFLKRGDRFCRDIKCWSCVLVSCTYTGSSGANNLYASIYMSITVLIFLSSQFKRVSSAISNTRDNAKGALSAVNSKPAVLQINLKLMGIRSFTNASRRSSGVQQSYAGASNFNPSLFIFAKASPMSPKSGKSSNSFG